jgi:hypothetical protein
LHLLQKIKFDTVSSHPVEGAKALTEDVTIPFETLNHGIIEHVCPLISLFVLVFTYPTYQVAVDAISPARILITTSSGALQLWQQGNLTWTREEGLANIVAAEFVELPEAEAVSGEGEESFIGRIRRQIRDAQVGVALSYTCSNILISISSYRISRSTWSTLSGASLLVLTLLPRLPLPSLHPQATHH